jgi:hypothetical protein
MIWHLTDHQKLYQPAPLLLLLLWVCCRHCCWQPLPLLVLLPLALLLLLLSLS